MQQNDIFLMNAGEVTDSNMTTTPFSVSLNQKILPIIYDLIDNRDASPPKHPALVAALQESKRVKVPIGPIRRP